MRPLVLILLLLGLPVRADKESLGALSVSDLTLRPTFLVAPPSMTDRGFGLGESSFAVQWVYEHMYSAHARVGPESLVLPPVYYVPSVNPEAMAVVEAYAEMNHPLGRVRMGKLPLEFGLEGAESESDLVFPRALLFEKRLVGLRDLGLSYAIEYNGFFTEFVVHNGEGGADKDGDYWYTGRWGYNFEKIQVGLAGQTGKTSPLSTLGSGNTVANVDLTQPAKWRTGGVFASFRPKQFHIQLEGYWGERVQEADGAVGYATGHIDVGYEWTEQLSTYLRYDGYDPDLKRNNDAVHRGAVAGVWTNRSRTSRWIVMYAHDINEGHNPSDSYRLIWSLSPSQWASTF